MRIWFGAAVNTVSEICVSDIFFNENWVDRAQECFVTHGNITDFADISMYKMNCHFIVGIVKLIYEFTHSLTSYILLYEFDIKKQNAVKDHVELHATENCPFKRTPVKVGTKSVGGKAVEGDMGFGAEKYLFGNNNLRMHMLGCNWNPLLVYFEQINCEPMEVKKKVRGRRNAGPQIKIYIKEQLGIKTVDFMEYELYLQTVRKSIHTLMGHPPNPGNARNVYDSFEVDMNQMIVEEDAHLLQYLPENYNLRNGKTVYTTSTSSSSKPPSILTGIPLYHPDMELKDSDHCCPPRNSCLYD